MERTLLVATTSYAGMGPYASEIINSFKKNDNLFFFLREFGDHYFHKNIKEDLLPRCYFYRRLNTHLNTLLDLFLPDFVLVNKILKVCSDNDINQVHFLNELPSSIIIKYFSQRNIKILGTVHDLCPHEAKKKFYKMIRHKVEAYKLSRSLRLCENIVTNEQNQYHNLKKQFPQKKVFYHSFPSLITSSVVEGNQMPFELNNLQGSYILFFGRFEKYKGLSLLYNAFTSTSELYNNYTLVIAGKGDLDFENNSDKVIVINRYILDSEVKMLYEKAQCVVYPYISGTQSGVLSLSFYFETPVLVSDIPMFKMIIEESNAGLCFSANNLNSLKEQLIKIVSIDTSHFKINGKSYYNSHYDVVSIRKALLSIYHNIG